MQEFYIEFDACAPIKEAGEKGSLIVNFEAGSSYGPVIINEEGCKAVPDNTAPNDCLNENELKNCPSPSDQILTKLGEIECKKCKCGMIIYGQIISYSGEEKEDEFYEWRISQISAAGYIMREIGSFTSRGEDQEFSFTATPYINNEGVPESAVYLRVIYKNEQGDDDIELTLNAIDAFSARRLGSFAAEGDSGVSCR